jgi:hypothetical protein
VSTSEVTALVGFLGVIAGAVTSGLVQIVQAYRTRKEAAEIAARIIYADLHLAWLEVTNQMANHLDLPVDPDLSRFLVAWTAQKNAFASGVEFREFHVVAGAFALLDSYLHFLGKTPKDEAWRQNLEYRLPGLEGSLNAAREVAWVAGGGISQDLPPG